MYKWPRELPPSGLNGLIVEAITFTINTISITFEKNYQITVESNILLDVEGKVEEIPIPTSHTRLVTLLGKTVRESVVDVDGSSLLLKFDDRFQVRIEGGDKEYECFHINANGKEFVV